MAQNRSPAVMQQRHEPADSFDDFLIDWAADAPRVDFVVMNPPFKLGLEFIHQGLRHARVGVAAFVRSSFVEGQERYQELFAGRPEALVMPFVERVALWKGVLLDPDVPVWREKPDHPDGGKLERPTSATSYSWLVWIKPPKWNGISEHRRIAPCRLRLTRPEDYPPLPEHLRAPVAEGLL